MLPQYSPEAMLGCSTAMRSGSTMSEYLAESVSMVSQVTMNSQRDSSRRMSWSSLM